MGVQSTLKVQHTDGRVFEVEIPVDCDILTLKLSILEQYNLDVSNVNLVFNGKLLHDDTTLSQNNINETHTVFLVERKKVVVEQPVQEEEVGPRAFAPEINVPVEMPPMEVVNVPDYQPLGESNPEDPLVKHVIKLGVWIRVYCLFCAGLSLFIGITSGAWIPALLIELFYILGYIGTRNLNRCLLSFPCIISLAWSFFSILGFVFGCLDGFKCWMLALLFVGIWQFIIFASMGKFISLIGRLNQNQKNMALFKIKARCCC